MLHTHTHTGTLPRGGLCAKRQSVHPRMLQCWCWTAQYPHKARQPASGFYARLCNVKNPVAKVNNFHTFTLRCGLAGRWFHILFFLMKKQDTSFCSKLLKGDCWPPRLFLHIDLAIPRADETCALGGSAWPGGSPGVTSSGRHLVMWLGIYTFMGRRIGRAGLARNAAASPRLGSWPTKHNPHTCAPTSAAANVLLRQFGL